MMTLYSPSEQNGHLNVVFLDDELVAVFDVAAAAALGRGTSRLRFRGNDDDGPPTWWKQLLP